MDFSAPSVALGLHRSQLREKPTFFTVDRIAKSCRRGQLVAYTKEGPLFKADHKKWSYKRDVTDHNGTELYKMRMDKIRLPMVYWLDTATTDKAAELKFKWSMTKANVDIIFNNFDGTGTVIELRSDRWTNDNISISWQGQQVGRILRRMNVPEQREVAQRFEIELAPNIDVSLIGAATIAFDEYCLMCAHNAAASASSTAPVVVVGAGA